MIFKKDNDSFLLALALKNNLDMDTVISGYLIMGDQFQMLLNVFEGKELKVPSKRRLSSPSLRNIRFIEDDERKFQDYVKGNIIILNDKDYEVVDVEKKILNHWYVPVVEVID